MPPNTRSTGRKLRSAKTIAASVPKICIPPRKKTRPASEAQSSPLNIESYEGHSKGDGGEPVKQNAGDQKESLQQVGGFTTAYLSMTPQKRLDVLERENEKLKADLAAMKAITANKILLDKSSVEDHFCCEICYSILWVPVLATCGHSFCEECINQWFVQLEEQHGQPYDDTNYECMKCREPVEGSYHINFSLKAAVELVANAQGLTRFGSTTSDMDSK